MHASNEKLPYVWKDWGSYPILGCFCFSVQKIKQNFPALSYKSKNSTQQTEIRPYSPGRSSGELWIRPLLVIDYIRLSRKVMRTKGCDFFHDDWILWRGHSIMKFLLIIYAHINGWKEIMRPIPGAEYAHTLADLLKFSWKRMEKPVPEKIDVRDRCSTSTQTKIATQTGIVLGLKEL